MPKITAQMLEDGNILFDYKNKYRESSDNNDLIKLLLVLRDSTVIVPAEMRITSDDESVLENAKEGDIIESTGDIHIGPDILKGPDEKLYFPLFSRKSEIPEEYGKNFSSVRLPVTQCIEIAHSVENVSGLVLDAFTGEILLPFAVADIITQLPSQIGENNAE